MHPDQALSVPACYSMACRLLQVFLLWLLLTSIPALAAEVALSRAEQRWLALHPVVRLGIDRGWIPYVKVQGDGRVVGIEPDLLARINALTGANLQLEVGQWKDMVRQAEQGQLEGLAASAAHPERAQDFLFSTSPYRSSRYIYLRNESRSVLRSMEDLPGRRVGVLVGNLAEHKVLERWPGIIAVELPTYQDLLLALEQKQVDGVVGAITLNHVLREELMPHIDIGFVVPGSEVPLLYSVRREHPELLSIINKGLAAIKPAELQGLLDRWGAYGEPQESFVELTERERQWLRSHPVVRTRIFNVPPLNYWDNGPRGIAVDIAEAILGKLGVRIEYERGIDWVETLKEMREGRGVDMLLNARSTPDRENYLRFSRDYLILPWMIFTRSDEQSVLGLDDLVGRTIAAEKSYLLQERLARDYPGIRQLRVDDTAEALEAVSTRRADAYVGNLNTVQYYLARGNFSNIKVAAGTTLGNHSQAFAARRDAPELASILDKGLAGLSVEERNAIQRKYTAVEVHERTNYALLLGVLLVLAIMVYWNRRLRAEVRLRKAAEARYRGLSEQLELLAFADGLTGIANRRHFDDQLEAEWRCSQRNHTPLALLMIDIDHFKQFNDHYGHQAGDNCLRLVAHTLQGRLMRPRDLVARYGGEEFVCLLPETDREGALAKAEDLRRAVVALQVPHAASLTANTVSISVGMVARIVGREGASEGLLEAADSALYQAKHGGRNRVVVWGEEVAPVADVSIPPGTLGAPGSASRGWKGGMV